MTEAKSRTVLLVEGNADERRALSNLLSGSGFDVVVAVDYEAAKKSLDKSVPDLAVIATRMSAGPSGFVALRDFKSRGGESAVALLPEPNFDEAVAAFRLGASDVQVKPPRATELVGALKRGLGELGDPPREVTTMTSEGEKLVE